MLGEITLIVFAYLVGSIPTGLLLAKAFGGVDIRESGSGNIGATNVYRTLGRKVGLLTLVGDCLKGVIPVVAAKCLGMPDMWIAAVGLAAFLGHVYTVFLGFKGGKGVATALGVFLAVSPLAVLVALAVFSLILVWNEFLFAVILTNQSHWPVTVALNNLAGSQLVQWNVLMAASVLVLLPNVLLFFFAQKEFVKGISIRAFR